jgi:L-asparaginase
VEVGPGVVPVVSASKPTPRGPEKLVKVRGLRHLSGMLILTTGGTIDKVYFDAASEFEVGEPTVPHIFEDVGADIEYELHPLFRKDSLEMTDEDRAVVRAACETTSHCQILITHGTDTMARTAEALMGIPGKVIVLTGALAPARFRVTDAIFNIGSAVGALQSLDEGVYLAMNGRIFEAGKVRKNREAGRFEVLTQD